MEPTRKVSSEDQEKAGLLIKQWEYLYGLRGNWNSHWTEIAQRIFPSDSWLFQNFSQLSSQGDKRNFEIYDSTGLNALQTFTTILDSLLTPRDSTWHHLRPEDDKLMKDRKTREWFDTVNTILFRERYKPTTNFEGQNQLNFKSLGAYGTANMFIDDLMVEGMKGLRYKSIHLGETYLQENHQGIVDRVCRHFMMTARQAMQRFPDTVPEQIVFAAEKFPDQQFFFLHWVMPRTDMDPERRDYKGMAYASHYVSIEGMRLLEEGGYRTFPYICPRYTQSPNEAYGRSPAMDVLPAIKTLNEQKKTMLKQGHRVVDPVYFAHDDAAVDAYDFEPGSMNPGGVNSDGRLLVQTLPTGNVQAGQELMEDERKLIETTFMVPLFQILAENKTEMTATEVMERAREKGILLAPTIGRQQSEYLGPMIERELDILSRQGKLPPQPPMLKSSKSSYKVVYDSPISRAQKAEAASGAMRTFELCMQVSQATGDPSYLDYMNTDVAIPKIADIYGTPAAWIRDTSDIQAIRRQRAHQQAVQTALQAAPAIAGLQKNQQGQPQPAPGQPQAPPPNFAFPQAKGKKP